MPDEDTNTEIVLSKSALKKQLKRHRIEEQREARKTQRKQLKKEKKARKRQNEDNDESTRIFHGTKKQDKERLSEALKSGVRLVIDLSLVHLMTQKEVGSLCRQLTIAYAENKRSLNPFHLYFTSFSGSFKELFSRRTPSYVNWKADFKEDSYLEIFEQEKESLLYLTADSTNDLSQLTATTDQKSAPLQQDCIFIIGGLIDRNRHKNVCFEQANEQKLRTAHLPLHLLEGGIKGSQVLTTNQCIEILIKYQEQLDWKSAIASVFPQRRRLEKDSIKKRTNSQTNDQDDSDG